MALHRVAAFLLALVVFTPITAPAQKLKGKELKAAAGKESWDESVKSLVAAPDVLSMMSDKLSWTQKLGDAVLTQQADIMDAIQRLRTKADANNKLTSTKQQTVTKRQEQGRQVITIESTDPETMHVPYYDPAAVYVVNDKMVGGFALVAYPAEYRNSGVMTFIVNHAGTVFQKDLGPNTERMTSFNPDKTWQSVTDTEPLR